MKYLKEFTGCDKCRGKGISGKTDGYIFLPETRSVIECDCHKRYEKTKNLFYKLNRNGFDNSDFILSYKPFIDIRIDADVPHYEGQKSKDSVKKLIEFKNIYLSEPVYALPLGGTAEDQKLFEEEYEKQVAKVNKFHNSTLYMYGPNGTQKTVLATWLAREIISSNYRLNHVKYYTMNDFIKELMRDSSWNEEENNFVDTLIEKVDMLILDESFDKEKVTLYKSGYQIPFLDTFLRKWSNTTDKSIVFISNVEPSKIEANGYSKSIQDLVERNIKLHGALLTFEDRYLDSVESISGGLFD